MGAPRPGIRPLAFPSGVEAERPGPGSPEGLSGWGTGAGQPVVGLVRVIMLSTAGDGVLPGARPHLPLCQPVCGGPGRVQRGDARRHPQGAARPGCEAHTHLGHGQHGHPAPRVPVQYVSVAAPVCAGMGVSRVGSRVWGCALPEITFADSHLPLLQVGVLCPMGPSAASGPLRPPPTMLEGFPSWPLRVSGQKPPVGWP